MHLIFSSATVIGTFEKMMIDKKLSDEKREEIRLENAAVSHLILSDSHCEKSL